MNGGAQQPPDWQQPSREDASTTLRNLNLELATRRAMRLNRRGSSRLWLRLLSVLLLFGLCLAALGAMWYLESRAGEYRSARHGEAVSRPAP